MAEASGKGLSSGAIQGLIKILIICALALKFAIGHIFRLYSNLKIKQSQILSKVFILPRILKPGLAQQRTGIISLCKKTNCF